MRTIWKPVLSMIIAAVVAVALAAEAVAQDGRLLGQTRLTRREHDLDYVRFAACQNVREIKLRALRGNAEIELLAVKYGNDAVDRLPVRHRLLQGSETQWIDLRGGIRCVRAIAVVGDTEGSFDQTIIQFFGR